MSNKTFRRSATAFTAAVLMAASLTGCGKAPMVNAAALAAAATPAFGAGMETEATSTLMQGFDKIHKAIFAKLDKDKNNSIDEYEAGPNLSLSDFHAADKNQDGKLTYAEFKKYAITTLFFLHDNPTVFTSRFRRQLGDVFKRLDTNGDGVLQKNETSTRDMAALKLTFEYPRLNIKVKISKINKDTFKTADKTGDGVLSQAEFEDLYIDMVLIALGSPPSAAPADSPAGDDPNAPTPPDSPVTTPTGGADVPPTPADAPTDAPAGDAPPAPPAPVAPKKSPRKK